MVHYIYGLQRDKTQNFPLKDYYELMYYLTKCKEQTKNMMTYDSLKKMVQVFFPTNLKNHCTKATLMIKILIMTCDLTVINVTC